MAKTYGARDLNEQQQKAIMEGRKQGRTHKELAQQFGISKSTVTKLLKRWKIQKGCIKKKKPDDLVALLMLSIATSSVSRGAIHVLRRRTLQRKY